MTGMNGIDVLRDSLEAHADLASDGAGLLDDVRAGAVRVRRRRLLIAVAGAVTVAVVAALAVGQFARPPAAQTPGAPYAREAPQLTAVVAPDSGFELQGYDASADVQHLVLGGEVLAEVHDPGGTYDPSTLNGTRRITLGSGAAGFAIPVFTPQGSNGKPAAGVARRDATGAWIIAYGAAPQDRLARAAVAVRIGAPYDAKVPFRLGFVPDGLRASSVDSTPLDVFTMVTFEDAEHRFMLQVLSQLGDNGQYESRFGAPAPIGGHDTWYLTESNSDGFAKPGQAMLIVQYQPGCTLIVVSLDSRTVTRAMLERMVREARFGSCYDHATWTAVGG